MFYEFQLRDRPRISDFGFRISDLWTQIEELFKCIPKSEGGRSQP
jgi:hypothetical protein